LIGGVETYAVLYEVGPGWDARVRNLAGVASVTLEPEAIRNMQARLAC
jgi:acyl homoserine lactone synthase